MAKGQKRSSREVKKPKADKNKPKAGAAATVASVTKKPTSTPGGASK